MSKHQVSNPPRNARVTPMTSEGVNDPTMLSAEGQLAHFSRRSGPGTRSKNPKHYDRNAEHYAAVNFTKQENREKSRKFLVEKSKAKKPLKP